MPTVHDDNNERVTSSDRKYDDFTPSPMDGPITADAKAPPFPVRQEPPTPDVTPENWACLRGPCRFYMETKSPADMIAPSGHEPIQTQRYCRAIPGVLVEMSSAEPMYDCTEWDPRQSGDVDYRRRAYFDEHPEVDRAHRHRLRVWQERDRKEAQERALSEKERAEAQARKDALIDAGTFDPQV